MMSAYKCTQEAANDVSGRRHASRLLGITKTNSHSTLFKGRFFHLWTKNQSAIFPVIPLHVQGSVISMEGPRFSD